VGGASFARYRQIRNKVRSALELDVNPAPGLVYHLAHPHQAVADGDRINRHRRGDCDNDPEQHEENFPFPTLKWFD
jgi:hypothetical protein